MTRAALVLLISSFSFMAGCACHECSAGGSSAVRRHARPLAERTAIPEIARDPAPIAAFDAASFEHTQRWEFDAVDPGNATTIAFFVDTQGLEHWDDGCGPTNGFHGCPDHLSVLDVKQQVIGLTRLGQHQHTTFRDDDQPDDGEWFEFRQADDPEGFAAARQALLDGVLYSTLFTDKADLPVEWRLFAWWGQ